MVYKSRDLICTKVRKVEMIKNIIFDMGEYRKCSEI